MFRKLKEMLIRPSIAGYPKWGKRLEHIVAKLRYLNETTEKEFLFLGERFQDFHCRAKEISAQSRSISARMSGEETTAVVSELKGIINRIENLKGTSQQRVSTLTSVLIKFEGTRRHLAAFEKTVLTLNMLYSSLRIESARIQTSDSGLITLVDHVRQLAANISLQSTHILNETEEMCRLLRENLTIIINDKEKQQGHARLILKDTGESLLSLTDRHERSASALDVLASRWDLRSKNIGEIVSSIQFQDITRQRIEHVIETLNGYIEKLSAHSMPIVSYEVITEAVQGCALQVAQLAYGKTEISAAVKRIVSSLLNVGNQIDTISEETNRLFGSAMESGHSYLAELKKRLSTLVGVLAEYTTVSRQLEKASVKVAETITRTSGLVKEIEKIGIDMNMIALNACIRAAHIGQAGLGVGILSESLHHLSVETIEHISTITSNLRILVNDASSLSAAASFMSEGGDPGCQTTPNLEALVEPIRRLSVETENLLAVTGKARKELVADIKETTEGISVNGQVEEIVEAVNSKLNEVMLEMQSILPASAELRRDENLGEVARRYTMHSEREIHDSLISTTGPAVCSDLLRESGKVQESEKATKLTTEAAPMENFGENVELF